MAEQSGNDFETQALVPLSERSLALPGEEARGGISLNEIREAVTSEGVLIPAGEGREPIRILPKPAYYRWQHGFDLIDDPSRPSRKSPPVFFAVYLIGVGDPPSEIRSIRLPVQTKIRGGIFREAESKMISGMIEDGMDPAEIQTYSPQNRSQEIVGRVGGNTLLGLQRVIEYGHFKSSGIHPELHNSAYPDSGLLESGWEPTNLYPLVVWSNWKAPISVIFDAQNEIDITNEKIISPPFSQESIAGAGKSDVDLLKRIVGKNRPGSGSLTTALARK